MTPKSQAYTGASEVGYDKDQKFCIATVQDAFAHTGMYLLQTPFGPNIPAVEVLSTSGLPLGARPLRGFMPKTKVLALYFGGQRHAIIFGAVPDGMLDAKLILPDSLVLCGRAGIAQEPMHFQAFNNQKSILSNHSCGRAADVLPGDWGYINDVGLAIFLGRVMASLRASDMAKIEAFWGDDLLRLCGYNLETFTAGMEDRRVGDEGEYNEIIKRTPFTWEGLGKDTPALAAAKKNGALKPNRNEATYEPIEPDQMIIPRHLVLRGYLGDIENEFVCAPENGMGTETFKRQTKYVGLLRINKHINGAFSIQSAKEITFEKTVIIPVPKELISPEDPLGDNRTNYKAADQLGSGASYDMQEFTWGEETSPIRATQLLDAHAYFFAKYTVGGLAAHKKDWFFPEESTVDKPTDSTVYDKNLEIGFKFYADLPSFGDVTIDQRPGHSVKYYKSRSIIKQCDDGSLLFEDGFGSQIHMTGGNIFASAVGDIWAKPGRNFVAWAPHDAILRAGNSADISASKHDVRIKAERNLHMLAGNDTAKIGGILLESRAKGINTSTGFNEVGEQVSSYGVVIKCPESSFHVISGDAYIGLSKDAVRKTLCIDAGDEGNVYLRGKNVLNQLNDGGIFGVVTDVEGANKQLLALNENSAVISAPVQIGGTVVIVGTKFGDTGQLLVEGGIATKGQIAAKGGIASKGAIVAEGVVASRANGDSFVAKLDQPLNINPDTDTPKQQITKQTDLVAEQIKLLEDAAVTDAEAPGNEQYIEKVGFSCRRTREDLKLDATFILYEARWQQMLRKKGGGKDWDEPVVNAPNGTPTMPHPGFDGWQTMQAYAEVNEVNLNYENGKANARDGLTPTGPAPQKKTLQSGYKINVQE